jgi:hypothetical protein
VWGAAIVQRENWRGDGGRGKENMVMFLMCAKIIGKNKDGNKSRQNTDCQGLASKSLALLDGIKKYLTNDDLIVKNAS